MKRFVSVGKNSFKRWGLPTEEAHESVIEAFKLFFGKNGLYMFLYPEIKKGNLTASICIDSYDFAYAEVICKLDNFFEMAVEDDKAAVEKFVKKLIKKHGLNV